MRNVLGVVTYERGTAVYDGDCGVRHSRSGTADVSCHCRVDSSCCSGLFLMLCQIALHVHLRLLFGYFIALEVKLSLYSMSCDRASDE
jgi:hypothetical protein